MWYQVFFSKNFKIETMDIIYASICSVIWHNEIKSMDHERVIVYKRFHKNYMKHCTKYAITRVFVLNVYSVVPG